MIVAFSTFKYPLFYYTVGAVIDSWASDKVKFYVTSKKEIKNGEGELHHILECLKTLNSVGTLTNNISTIIIDGFVWSTNDNHELIKGFGALLSDSIKNSFNITPTILGISEEPYSREIPYSVKITRGIEEKGPLWITSTEYLLADYDAKMVERMNGDEKLPTIIQKAKTKAREFLEDEASLILREAAKKNKN